MALMNKPDEKIFASKAKEREVEAFPDHNRGWGVSFEQTEGIPPMEWFNALFKRLDENILYVLQRGLPEWSATITYPKGAYVQYGGLSYKSLQETTNKKPNEDNSEHWARWGLMASDLVKATLTQFGITQLFTGYDSDREDLALTPKTAKMLKALIDSNTRSLGNYIPNSKKSDAIDSLSSDNVATSLAAKKAYDKAVAAEELARTKYTAQIATTTQRGLTHHYSGYDSDSEDFSASAKAIKIIKGFIDSNTRNFGNYIPNSKKSNAVNSPSADTVATSAAVKTANDNANGRVNRAGDTMDGALLGKSGGMSTNNPNNIGFVFSGDNDSGMSNPQDGILQLNVNGQTVFEASALSKNTRLRNIADYTMDLQNDGNLVVKKGDSVLWHAFSTLLKSEFYDFRNKFTMATYNGTNSSSFVFRIPISQNLGVKMYVSQIRIDANLAGHRFNLAEAFTGYRVAMVTSADGNRRPLGAHLTSDTQVTINCDSIPTIQTVNLLVVGNYQY